MHRNATIYGGLFDTRFSNSNYFKWKKSLLTKLFFFFKLNTKILEMGIDINIFRTLTVIWKL